MEDKDCCGVIGRFFGHNYHSMLEYYTPQEDIDKKIVSIVAEYKGMKGYWSEIISSMNRTLDNTIEASSTKQYKIVCKRCGKVISNNGNGEFMVKDIEKTDV